MQEVLREIAERDDVQNALPDDPNGRRPRNTTGTPAPGAKPREARPREARPRDRRNLSSGDASGLGTIMAWGLVVAVVVMLVVALVNGFAERQRRETTATKKKLIAPTPRSEAAPPPLRDFEQLAVEGRYAEAVHAMLLHAFVQLATRRATGWPAAKTGREILAAVGGFATADLPLRLVFQTSEAAWFGKADVDRAQYEQCLGNYRSWSIS